MELKIIYWAVLLVTFLGIYLLGSRTDLKLWVRVMAALLLGAIIGLIFGDLTHLQNGLVICLFDLLEC